MRNAKDPNIERIADGIKLLNELNHQHGIDLVYSIKGWDILHILHITSASVPIHKNTKTTPMSEPLNTPQMMVYIEGMLRVFETLPK